VGGREKDRESLATAKTEPNTSKNERTDWSKGKGGWDKKKEFVAWVRNAELPATSHQKEKRQERGISETETTHYAALVATSDEEREE